MRILLATDAWSPQVNGVVITLGRTIDGMRNAGHEVEVVGPEGFRTIPCPSYPEIRLAVAPFRRFAALADAFAPDAVHIATEGPLGEAARRWCLARRLAFTTAYHTRFPEYVHARIRLPVAVTYAWLRRFHAPASAVMVATRSIHDDRGTTIDEAGPSMPVRVTGLSALPGIGEPFHVVGKLDQAKEVAEERSRKLTKLAELRGE